MSLLREKFVAKVKSIFFSCTTGSGKYCDIDYMCRSRNFSPKGGRWGLLTIFFFGGGREGRVCVQFETYFKYLYLMDFRSFNFPGWSGGRGVVPKPEFPSGSPHWLSGSFIGRIFYREITWFFIYCEFV